MGRSIAAAVAAKSGAEPQPANAAEASPRGAGLAMMSSSSAPATTRWPRASGSTGNGGDIHDAGAYPGTVISTIAYTPLSVMAIFQKTRFFPS